MPGTRVFSTVFCCRMTCLMAVLFASMSWGQGNPAIAPMKAAATVDVARTTAPKDLVPQKTAPKVDPFTLSLRSDEAAEQQKGVDGIKALFARDPAKAIDRFKQEWLGLLLTTRHYQEVVDLSLLVELGSVGDMQTLEQMQRARVRALIALGKPEEALSNAKSYYNVASMKGTAEAIMAVVQCLNITPSADSNRLDRFKAQQLLSSNSVAALKELAGGPSVLGSIRVSAEPYSDTLCNYGGEDFANLTARGNLLLLADRTREAGDVFERAYVVADDHQVNLASENIARAMKAVDGNISRANEWVLSIRPPPVPVKPPGKPVPAQPACY